MDGFWEGVPGSWASPLKPDGERGKDAAGAGEEGRGVDGGKEPEPGNVPGTDVGGTALRTANKLVHSAEAWFVRRRRASEERRRDQSLAATLELQASNPGIAYHSHPRFSPNPRGHLLRSYRGPFLPRRAMNSTSTATSGQNGITPSRAEQRVSGK